MLRLNLAAPAEPTWHEVVPGLRFRVKRLDTPLLTLAAARVPPAEENRTYAVVVAAAKLSIVEWEGVGDQDGAPLPVTPEAVEAVFAAAPAVYGAFYDRVYMPAFGAHLIREDEKND